MKRILLIDRGRRKQPVSYSDDWVDAFQDYSGAQVDVLSDPWLLRWGRKLAGVFLDSQYDGIFVMHSVSNDMAFGHAAARVIGHQRGPVYMFLGNEYRGLSQKIDLAHELGCAAVISQLPGDIAEKLYEPFFAGRVLSIPHALNEKVFKPVTPLSKRPIDVGYRGEKYPYHLGHDERDRLFELLKAQASTAGIRTDFAAGREKGQRLDRDAWAAFLNTCRTTVGTETGAEYLSISEKKRQLVNAYMDEHPLAPFEQVDAEVIQPLTQKHTFVSGRAISSRHFDAIGCGTALIAFPGRFNDILKEGEHYIALKRDLSNLPEVLEQIKDTSYLEAMTERTRRMVLEKHCLKHRVEALMALLN